MIVDSETKLEPATLSELSDAVTYARERGIKQLDGVPVAFVEAALAQFRANKPFVSDKLRMTVFLDANGNPVFL